MLPLGAAASREWCDAWAATASRGRLAWGAPEWAALGIETERIARGLADAEIDAGDPALPAWVAPLHWFLGNLPRSVPDVEAQGEPLTAILASSYAAGLACVADLRRDGTIPPTWGGQTDARVATALAGRIASAQARALQPEVIASRALGIPLLPAEPEDWRERLLEYPGLARPIGIAVQSWRDGIADLVTHWSGDIRDDGRFGASVVDVRLGLGDPHQGGQSVALLLTDTDASLIHKPKPQGGPAVWQQIVDAVFQHPACADAGVRSVARRISDRGAYGWDELLDRDPPGQAGVAPSQTWLRSFGALVRVCELLECRDMWLDNLITHADVPVYIDVETVLQPRQRTDPAADLIAETSLPTGAISLPIRLPDGSLEDIGVMRRPGVIGLPFRREDLGGMTPIGAFGADGIMRWEPEPWRPAFAESVEPITEILIGYDSVDAALADTELAARLEALVRALAEQPSRVVLRSTFTCYSLMQDSLRPEVMHDGRARDIALAALQAPAVEALLAGWPAADARWLAALGHADALALSRLDVPLVRHDPRTGATTLDDGAVIPAPDGRIPALDLCLARLRDPARHRSVRREVVRALVAMAMAAGRPDAAHEQDAALAHLAFVVAEALDEQGIHDADARTLLAEFGYVSAGASSSS